MALSPGTRLGPYEIVAVIGAGGMGEVYRARDTKLDRDVAVKVLPAQLADSPTALARFEREAKAVAALSHPNILSIFDFGTESGTAYAVTELLEGETLRVKLRAPLPVRKAIDYAVQAARGLAGAHAKGIVHRDLKPENLFVTADGRLKILDFGLARQTLAFTGADATFSPTLERHTDPGTVLGTVGYMSPEQVRGEAGDHRSDLFSFGAVLYELVSGRRAFQRGTAAETMTAILREDPPELASGPATVSPGLSRIIRHCLEKAPNERFQSASDVAFALEALDTLSSGSTPAAHELTASPSRARRSTALIAAALAIVIVAAAAFYAGRSTGAFDRQVSFTPLTYQQQTIFRALFTPDGKTVVFSAALTGVDVELFTIDPQFPEARRLGLRNTQLLSVSSKGELAVLTHATFISHRLFEGTLARVPLGGGAPREILEHVREADWSPDGESLAIIREMNGRDRLEFPAGTVWYESSGYLSDLRVSPSGDRVALFEHRTQGDDRGSVIVVDRHSRKTMSGGVEYWGVEGLAWSRDGREVLYSGGQSYAQFKVFATTLDGHVRGALASAGGLTLFDVGPKGQWLAARDDVVELAMVRPPGAKEDVNLSWLDLSAPIALSRDGTTLVFNEESGAVGDSYAVCLRKTDGSPVVQLGEGHGEDLSPDGKWVMAVVLGSSARLMMYPTGAGEPHQLDRGSIERYTTAKWFPDGKRIAVCGNESGRAPRCFVQDAIVGPPRPVTPENTSAAVVSPDGASLLVRKGDQAEIHRLAGGAPVQIPEITKDDVILRWDSGDTLIVANGTLPMRLERFRLDTRRRELIRTIAPANPVGVNGLTFPVVAADPNVYAYALTQQLSHLFLIQGAR